MGSVERKHLGLLIAVPLAIATATGLAQGPLDEIAEPEDHHVRPAKYAEPTLADELTPIPSSAEAEYPLAVAFNPADPSNYTAGGMISHDYVVVHTMQGYYYGAQSWFQNPDANVSAHFCMQSEDGEVTQMVELGDRAWHVGNSNAYAIGIEHEGFVDEPAWYTWAMYESSAMLARWSTDEYAMPRDREHVVGHVDLPNQTHTDPGIHWNWELYMALIEDVVSEGVVEGYVVDRGQACTVTATVDTWIKQTLEDSDALDDTQKCSIPAGTSFAYLHASADMVGHRRLRYDALGHPCEGVVGLDEAGFGFAEHYAGLCEATSLAVAGVMVTLDGGAVAVTDANGKFVFEGVAIGPHSVDVIGASGYADTTEPIDVEVYPGTRVIVGLDPLDAGGDSGDDGEGECWIGELDCACTLGGGCDPGLVCEAEICVPDTQETGEAGPGFDDGRVDDDTGYCSIGDPRPSPLGSLLVGLGLLGLGLGRRRAFATV